MNPSQTRSPPKLPRSGPPASTWLTTAPNFTWAISLWRPVQAPPGPAARTPANAVMPGPLTAVSRETKPRILLVDDDPVVLELSATLLRHAGYDVDTAADGEGGWAALTTSHYDLLLTDHNMPRLTGLELAERIRASGSLIPIVIASGSLTRDDLETALRPLVNVVLSKPVGSNLLLETVALLLKASPAPAPVHP